MTENHHEPRTGGGSAEAGLLCGANSNAAPQRQSGAERLAGGSAEPLVLDACCGSRMMWLDKEDERVTFVDRRNEDYEIKPDRAYPSGTVIKVRPDVVADFTALPFPDASFWHVVFDPPHIIRNEELGTVTKKYGCLNGDWKAMLAGGFSECFRVLKPHGTLIFKWCETQIPLREILALTPQKPLYGHKGGQKSVTHWVAFVKQGSEGAERAGGHASDDLFAQPHNAPESSRTEPKIP